MVFLHHEFRCVNLNDIDKIISTEIPNKETDIELFQIVYSLIIHGPYGAQNKNSPCMQNGKCTKYFPKRFLDSTTIDISVYPIYRRRDNGHYIKNGECFVDNMFSYHIRDIYY